MQFYIWLVLIGLVGGMAVAIQAALAGIISDRMGLIENALIVFGSGFIFALVLFLAFRVGQPRDWSGLPWYVLLAGPLGIMIIISIGYTTSRFGLASALTLIIVSQLIVGTILDHYGWLTIPRPMNLSRLIGIGLLILGTWVVLR